MANNDLLIEIISTLNIGKSLSEINNKIKAIEKSPSLRNVKLIATIDDKKLQKSIDDALKKINASFNIDINGIKNTNNQIDNVQKKMKTFVKMKDSQFINPKVEKQAFNEISARIRDVRKNVDELAKVDISTNRKGQMTGATLTYYNQELGKTVRETMGWREAQKTVNGELVKFKTFETLGFKYSDNMAKARKETEKLNQAAKNIELYKKKMLGDGQFTGQLDIFATKQKGRYDPKLLTSIRNEIEALNSSTPNAVNKIRELDIQFASLNKSASQSGSIMARALENAAKFARFYLVGGFLVSIVNSIKSGIGYVAQLDNSLNEIRIVTNKSQQEVEALGQSYNDLAKEMSVTTKEVVSTAADLYRQGLNDTQVEERMKSIIQYAKISSISLEESSQIITATANATGESVQKIIDIFSFLGDASASGADEVGQALQKVASAAENSGISIEKSASWINYSPFIQ